LKLAVTARAAELASRSVAAALDPDLAPERAIRGILDLVDAVDPKAEVLLSEALPEDREGVEALGYKQLLALAEAHGIALPALEP